MAFHTMTADVAHISKLGDQPNTDNNLTAAELKARFDQAAVELKAFINSLVAQLNDRTVSAQLRLSPVAGLESGTVQEAIAELSASLAELSGELARVAALPLAEGAVNESNLVDEIVTERKLANGAVSRAKLSPVLTLAEGDYGTELPAAPQPGQLFFRVAAYAQE